MSAESTPMASRLDWVRQALRNDSAKLGRLNEAIEHADSTPGVPDDLDHIARLLDQAD